MGIWYRAGTISVANGSAVVTGLLTTWLVYVRPGDGISFDGGAKWYEVLSVDSNTQITLAENFAETTISGGSYVIDNRSYRHQIETEILETLRQTLAGQTQVIETSGPPSSTIGADKSIAFDPDARAYYHKSGGSWGDAISLGGADGVDAGFQFAFDGSVSMADPGLGKFRFNNATFGSITAIAIDDASNDIGNPDVSAYVTTWGASTSSIKGTLIVRKVGSSAFRVFAVTGLTDNAGWSQLAVTPVAAGGTINAADQCAAAFIRTGDKGSAGADGANAGFLMTLDRATTTMVDPGPGKIKFNNASFNSVTALAISDLSFDNGNPDVSAFILAWINSTNTVKGQMRIAKVGAPQNFVIFDLTGLTDNSGWTQLALTFRAAGGTLMTNDVCAVTFAQAGNVGLSGWTPVFSNVSDGARRVLQVIDWTGGTGTKPVTGKYVGSTGLVDAIGDAADIRGPQGAPGTPGADGSDFHVDAVGLFSGRSSHDSEAAGFCYLSTDGDGASVTTAVIFFLVSPGVWSSPIPFISAASQNAAINVIDYGADPTETNDSAGAIQAAFNVASALAGNRATVRIPSTPSGATYIISTALVWPANISIVCDTGVRIKATSAMDALLRTGTGNANRLRGCSVRGGIWDGNFLAQRGIWIKDGNTVLVLPDRILSVGPYVDGTSEQPSAYIDIGDPAQLTTCYEIFIPRPDYYRFLGAVSPTPAPAKNYGIRSENRASDSHVGAGVISGVKKAIYGQCANWLIDGVHHWNYAPGDGAADIPFHFTSFGGLRVSNCEAGVDGDGSGFKWESNSGELPSSMMTCEVIRESGTDGAGWAFDIGSNVNLVAKGNLVSCDVTCRYASDFGGDLTGLQEDGTLTRNVVAPVGYGSAIANGSAGVPAVRFAGDRDTGIYRPSANALGVAAGGVQIAQFDAFGIASKVGVVESDKYGGPAVFQTFRTDAHGPSSIVGRQDFYGSDSLGSTTNFARVDVTALDNTDGSEDGEWAVKPLVAGSQVTALSVSNGVKIGPATGGYKGTGTVNATALYANGVQPILKPVIQVFKNSGTYTPSPGMLYAIVEAQGGGGGGGGASSTTANTVNGGGGGGAGAYSRVVVTAAQVGANQTVTIGSAGSAGTAGNNAGGSGGDTSLGTLCVAKGGSGGSGAAAVSAGSGGAGGSAASGTGTLTIDGGLGYRGGAASVSTVTIRAYGAQGANSHYGQGAPATYAGPGNTASGYGAGGGGGSDSNAGGDKSGGAGTAGILVITEFCSS